MRELGLQSYDETVRLLRGADLLFLPMHNVPAGVRAGLIPYKTFDYLGAQRPVLAAVPDGDVRDMLSPLPNVTVVRPDDVDAMTAALRRRVRPSVQRPAGANRTRCARGLRAAPMRGADRRCARAVRKRADPLYATRVPLAMQGGVP